ncbi:MAG TPA: biotin carboxylase N-terminal domain-containing protein [Gaiellaceae bacterium]|nr:biotin carboxylase N-terminal domain-containing protein [Gaiellaceae bacterium]
MSRRIRKLLVANRGEIAVRVFRTCRELGIETVAVAEPADTGSLHTRSAGETVAIASYLDASEYVRAARESGAEAVHPGYGFLSESAELAEAVLGAGLVWIGPPPAALRAGGDKLAAKRIAREAGVPVVEEGEPDALGFPLLVKAAAGGGGRGMRVVRSAGELDAALEAARREAGAAFGDDTVFCERYVERARHVEVQLLADRDGVFALGERDCSIQRRHQKVLEESPSPAVDEALRAELSDAAVRFATAIGYLGAGTAEFMVAGREFFFLELNARIQVEHPVTEAVTGRDLVADQISIAQGGRVERGGLSPGTQGHAVEVRLYAEDPKTFLPQTGRIERLRLPGGIRVDQGVEEGDEVGTRYDPMIAKLIAHGSSRDESIAKLSEALAETEVRGVVTNLPFLRWLVGHRVFRAGDTTTDFLTRYPPLSPAPPRLPDPVWATPFRLNLPSPSASAPPDLDDPSHAHAPGEGAGTIAAPMPGTVIGVNVAAGDTVAARDALVVIEAMKMEMPLTASRAGRIRAVHVAEVDTVARGTVLVEMED